MCPFQSSKTAASPCFCFNPDPNTKKKTSYRQHSFVKCKKNTIIGLKLKCGDSGHVGTGLL